MYRSRIHGIWLALLALNACAAPAAEGPPRAAARSPAPPQTSALLGPARYLYVDRLGTFFDEAGAAATLPGPEPALLDGVRVVVESGIVLAHADAAEKLSGFRSLPPRLGGGFALWSGARTYRARTFLGELEAIVDIGASGGVRPLLRTFLLRTPVGALEVDPTSLVARRVAEAGLAEALGLDERRLIRLDLLGRATMTTDGGERFVDVTRERGVSFSTLTETTPPALLLGGASSGPGLHLAPEGALAERHDPALARGPSADDLRLALPSTSAFPRSSRALPDDLLAHAVAHGALLPASPGACAIDAALCVGGGSARLLGGRPHGLRLFALATAQVIGDAELTSFDETLGGCQPLLLDDAPGRSPVLLACTGDRGAALLSLPDHLVAPRLHRTFPDPGVFVVGPRGRLGFPGRCGPFPASSDDLGRRALPAVEPTNDDASNMPRPSGTTPPPEEPDVPEAPPADPPAKGDARICLRVDADTWVERWVRGADRAQLYRWVPGDGGRVTALLLGKRAPAEPALQVGDGVRMVWIDPLDPALQGGMFPALRPAGKTTPRTIDDAMWEDDDGAIRGWIRLPTEGEPAGPPAPIAEGTATQSFPVEVRRGGRWAGLRIDQTGTVEVLPLPPGVTEVVRGGRFALAMAIEGSGTHTYASTDGGRGWAEVEGPPVGRIEAPADDDAPFGCSVAGCALGGGAVRLGWGSPSPPPSPGERPFTPAKSPLFRGPRPLRITCHFDSLVSLIPHRDPSSPSSPPSTRAPLGARPAAPLRPRVTLPKATARPAGRAAGEGPAPSRVSLHLEAASFPGVLRDGRWTGEVWLPFQPGAALKRLTAEARAPLPAPGAVVPVLAAGAKEPWDLLLVLGKERLRIGEGRAFHPFEAPARFTIAADTGDGATLLLDPDKGLIALARGDDQSVVVRLLRVPDVSRTRLTLARDLGGKGVSLLGYSTATGEVFVGAIDLGRAEVGPLSTLGRLDTLATPSPACGDALPYRFLAELSTSLRVRGEGGAALLDREVQSSAWIEGNGQVLCVRGVEASLGRGREGELSARFGPGSSAALRRAAERIQGTCAIDAAR